MFIKPRKSKSSQPAIDRQQALRCIPLKNPQAAEHPRDDGLLLVYPATVKPIFRRVSRLLTGKEHSTITRKIELDGMGSGVWRLIDGHRSVAEIAEIFRGSHKLEKREAEISVSAFFRELGRRGLIILRQAE